LSSDEIHRFNLEQGRFQTTLKTTSNSELNCCEFNPVHELFTCGSTDGLVECWDPRTSPAKPVGLLNCAVDSLFETHAAEHKCAVTTLKYRDGLNLAVGTSTGHVLLYDLRSSKPLLVKDHRYELPIKDLQWHKDNDMVLSIDKRACKIWDRHSVSEFYF
jgi:ribosome biogenesis protein ENP2